MKKKLFRFHPAFPIHDESRLTAVFERFSGRSQNQGSLRFVFLEGPNVAVLMETATRLVSVLWGGGRQLHSSSVRGSAQSGIGVTQRLWKAARSFSKFYQSQQTVG